MSEDTREDLTVDLIELLGDDGFLALIEACPGWRLYIPDDLERSNLPELVGMDNAHRLCKRYRCTYIRVPVAKDVRALRYRHDGSTNRQIAVRLGMTETGVEKLFKRLRKAKPGKVPRSRKDPRQLDMFGPSEAGPPRRAAKS